MCVWPPLVLHNGFKKSNASESVYIFHFALIKNLLPIRFYDSWNRIDSLIFLQFFNSETHSFTPRNISFLQ